MTTDQFFKILSNSAKFSPPTNNKWERLQSFAALRSISDLNSDNLSKNIYYKNKPYFYSRIWAQNKYPKDRVKVDFPLLVAVPVSLSANNYFDRNREEVYRIELSVLYPNLEKKSTESRFNDYKKLLVEEIYPLASDLLLSVFAYISNLVAFTADEYPTQTWMNKGHYDHLLANSDINNPIIDIQSTKSFSNKLRQLNPVMEGVHNDDYGKDLLCGVTYVLMLPVDKCVDKTFDFTTKY